MSTPQHQIKPPKPASITVDLSGQTFVIRRMSPEVGSFITTRILLAAADQVGQAVKDGTLFSAFTAFLRGLDFEAFKFVQHSCLAVVDRMEKLPGITAPTAMPIMNQDGSWTAPDVAADLQLVLGLTTQSLMFNVADFFAQSGSPSMPSGSRPPVPTTL